MNTMKITALLAVMTMAAGVAIAQPAETTGTEEKRPRAERRDRQGDDNPVAKLRAAATLDSATAEQKQQIRDFMEARGDQFEQMREETREAMRKARQATDRAGRRAAMEPIRQKHQAMQQEIQTFLQGLLNEQQMQQLQQKTKNMMQKGRMGKPGKNDGATTGTKRGARRRAQRENDQQSQMLPGAAEATTTASGSTVNPFANP